jgi:predicted transcriptional regulator
MKMMDVRDRIVKLLDQGAGKRFSVGEIAQEIGSNAKATTAALGRLYKEGRVDRPQKGVYVSKTQRGSQKTAKTEKASAKRAAGPSMSIVSIDLLVTGEASKVDVSGLRKFALEDPTVLDFKVRKTLNAERSKLKVSFALPETE